MTLRRPVLFNGSVILSELPFLPLKRIHAWSVAFPSAFAPFLPRGRKRAQLSESIDSKTKSGGNLLRERYSRKSDLLVLGFAWHTQLCVRAAAPPARASFPSFLGARKIFSVVSSRGDATTMRSCAPDNGREPPENFTRTMSPRVYHSVVYEFALVYHSTAWHFSSFHLNGWRSPTSFVDRFVRIALHYFGIESFF